MGVFSWLTADTNESIVNRYAAKENPFAPSMQTAYLLQPDGRPAIEEPNYGGYGIFGGVDAYAWLARENLTTEQLDGLDEDSVRGLGITLEMGEWFRDTETGKAWVFNDENAVRIMPGLTHHQCTYDGIVPELSMTPNQVAMSNRFEKGDFRAFMKSPLKFSFKADASYQSLRASKLCPAQGHFYGPTAQDLEDLYGDESDDG